jgi:hypothetical protein
MSSLETSSFIVSKAGNSFSSNDCLPGKGEVLIVAAPRPRIFSPLDWPVTMLRDRSMSDPRLDFGFRIPRGFEDCEERLAESAGPG